MKIAINHLLQNIKEKSNVDDISNKLFQLGHEHEIQNNIINLEITPNRGDCLSLNGILRDLGAFYSINKNLDIYNGEIEKLLIDFENLSINACPKISFLKLEVEEIPKSYSGVLKDYFSDMQIKANNFFTDISNYLSYETGQPTHCYDAKKINSKITFHERNCNAEFDTLLDQKVLLKETNAVFLQDNKVINLAGVMGGKSTSCSNTTKTVIVECAFFNPESLMGKSVQYDIQSDAAHKFERGVDPECHDHVLRRFIKIVSDHSNIKDLSLVTYNYKDINKNQILIDENKINQIIGIDISKEQYISYLSKLGFDIDGLYINIPSFRSDIKNQNDLAEEVARVIGYNNIPVSDIQIPKKLLEINTNIENKLRFFLLDHGFTEVINSPFVGMSSVNSIEVDNPLDSNRKYLRTNIKDSLVNNLLFNERKQKDSIKLFEISDVYTFNNGIKKQRRLAVIASGRLGLNYKDFSKKIDLNYMSNTFQKLLSEKYFNFELVSREKLDTKIKSEIIAFEISTDKFHNNKLDYVEESTSPKEFIKYSPISEFPQSYKDISYLINDLYKIEELQKLIFNYKNKFLKNVFVFDYYENKKLNVIKIGFRFTFQSIDKTLTSEQIESALNDIIEESLKIDGIKIPGFNLDS